MYPDYYYRQHQHQSELPPGYYIHSDQLPNTMKATRPTYWVNFEPIFFDHLMLHLNKKLKVKTVNETLVGVLTGVAVDHFQLTVDSVDYHIRNEQTIHFSMA